jgi:hypothetical protein
MPLLFKAIQEPLRMESINSISTSVILRILLTLPGRIFWCRKP